NCCIPSTMHQYLIQWDGDEVEVVHADDSSEVSLVDMNAWDAEGQEAILGIALEDCDRIEATKKQTEAGLIHWPHRVDASWHVMGCNRDREAGPSDRPQKIKKSCSGLELLHYVHTMACSGSWPLIDYLVPNNDRSIEAARPCGWPNNYSCHLPVFAADLVDNEDSPAFAAGFSDDGKLGYGFTSADDLEEVDIGPGDKPRPTFISKKLDPVLREEM